MVSNSRPLVLVHGLWDSPRLFDRLINNIDSSRFTIMAPSLPHKLGRTSIYTLAETLDQLILDRWEPETAIDLLGFSMGGLIVRTWLQKMGGASRTRRFISVGSPHQGTFLAQLAPRYWFAGLADMRRGSELIEDLNKDISPLKKIDCHSFFCRWDLMVIPGWQAVLPVGLKYSVEVVTHKGLISHPRALGILSELISSK